MVNGVLSVLLYSTSGLDSLDSCANLVSLYIVDEHKPVSIDCVFDRFASAAHFEWAQEIFEKHNEGTSDHL